MAYSDFSFKEVTQRFHLAIVESPDLFPAASDVELSPALRGLLAEYTPLAMAINTEKARSELLSAPILVEVRIRLGHRISLFSGVDFTVDPELGLNGFCDFILCRSPEQQFITTPVMVLIEAKNENLKGGLGQCVAAMVGARVFNEREQTQVPAVYGGVTSGTLWRFLKLEGNRLTLDQREYHIERLPRILGILVRLLSEPEPGPAPLANPAPGPLPQPLPV